MCGQWRIQTVWLGLSTAPKMSSTGIFFSFLKMMFILSNQYKYYPNRSENFKCKTHPPPRNILLAIVWHRNSFGRQYRPSRTPSIHRFIGLALGHFPVGGHRIDRFLLFSLCAQTTEFSVLSRTLLGIITLLNRFIFTQICIFIYVFKSYQIISVSYIISTFDVQIRFENWIFFTNLRVFFFYTFACWKSVARAWGWPLFDILKSILFYSRGENLKKKKIIIKLPSLPPPPPPAIGLTGWKHQQSNRPEKKKKNRWIRDTSGWKIVRVLYSNGWILSKSARGDSTD